MYGDTMVIRRLARDLREQAIDIRAEARALDGKVQSTTWTGKAADAMRTHAARRLIDLHDSARGTTTRRTRSTTMPTRSTG